MRWFLSILTAAILGGVGAACLATICYRSPPALDSMRAIVSSDKCLYRVAYGTDSQWAEDNATAAEELGWETLEVDRPDGVVFLVGRFCP